MKIFTLVIGRFMHNSGIVSGTVLAQTATRQVAMLIDKRPRLDLN